MTRRRVLVLRRSQPCQLVAERGDGGIHDIVAERRAQGFLRGDRPLELLPVGAHCFAGNRGSSNGRSRLTSRNDNDLRPDFDEGKDHCDVGVSHAQAAVARGPPDRALVLSSVNGDLVAQIQRVVPDTRAGSVRRCRRADRQAAFHVIPVGSVPQDPSSCARSRRRRWVWRSPSLRPAPDRAAPVPTPTGNRCRVDSPRWTVRVRSEIDTRRVTGWSPVGRCLPVGSRCGKEQSHHGEAEERFTAPSIPRELANTVADVLDLRKDRILERRRVSDLGVQRCHASHRTVEPLEELVDDTGGDLRAESPG